MPKIYTKEQKKDFTKRLRVVKNKLPKCYTHEFSKIEPKKLYDFMRGKSMNFNMLEIIEKELDII